MQVCTVDTTNVEIPDKAKICALASVDFGTEVAFDILCDTTSTTSGDVCNGWPEACNELSVPNISYMCSDFKTLSTVINGADPYDFCKVFEESYVAPAAYFELYAPEFCDAYSEAGWCSMNTTGTYVPDWYKMCNDGNATAANFAADLVNYEELCTYSSICTTFSGCNEYYVLDVNYACENIGEFENSLGSIGFTADDATAFCDSLASNGRTYDEKDIDDSFDLGGFCEQYSGFCVDGFPDLDAVCDNTEKFPYEVFAGNSFLSICEVDFSDVCIEHPEMCATTGEFNSDLCTLYPEKCDQSTTEYNPCAADLEKCFTDPNFDFCSSFPELCGYETATIEVPLF